MKLLPRLKQFMAKLGNAAGGNLEFAEQSNSWHGLWPVEGPTSGFGQESDRIEFAEIHPKGRHIGGSGAAVFDDQFFPFLVLIIPAGEASAFTPLRFWQWREDTSRTFELLPTCRPSRTWRTA